MRPVKILFIAFVLVLLASASACAALPSREAAPSTQPPEQPAATQGPPEKAFEDFNPNNFSNPTEINNPYFPMKPGTQFIYEGTTEEDGEKHDHRLEFTVTDLTKEIAGVRTVVAWVLDYDEGELKEKEIAFFAQDKDGNVWYLGEHPEDYEDGNFVEAPTWIHGVQGAVAGIKMLAQPKPDTPSYSAGWGPAVDFKDRGRVAEIVAENCVPVNCYKDVILVEEYTAMEPGAFQLKYYAPGVGNIRVGWKGTDEQKEELELIEMTQLGPLALAEIHKLALELDQHAYEVSKDVYSQTSPAQ